MFDPDSFRCDVAHAMRAAGSKGFESTLRTALKAVAPPEPTASMATSWRATFYRGPNKLTELVLVERADGTGRVISLKPEHDAEGYLAACVIEESSREGKGTR